MADYEDLTLDVQERLIQLEAASTQAADDYVHRAMSPDYGLLERMRAFRGAVNALDEQRDYMAEHDIWRALGIDVEAPSDDAGETA